MGGRYKPRPLIVCPFFTNLTKINNKNTIFLVNLYKNILKKGRINDMEIKIKYHNPDLIKIEKIKQGDWLDLRAATAVELKAGQSAYINLGVSICIPEGYEAHLAPRSSTFKNYGILQTNSIGVIDNSYSGENDIWMMPVYATRDTKIEFNDRICQFRIISHQPEHNIVTVTKLDDTDRGGFGSTGKQ